MNALQHDVHDDRDCDVSQFSLVAHDIAELFDIEAEALILAAVVVVAVELVVLAVVAAAE